MDDAYMPTILPRRERRSWKKVFGRRRREGRSRAHATVLQLQLRPPSSVLCQTWRLRGKDDELCASSSSSISRRGGRPRPPGRGWQRKGRRRGGKTQRAPLWAEGRDEMHSESQLHEGDIGAGRRCGMTVTRVNIWRGGGRRPTITVSTTIKWGWMPHSA